MYQLFERIYAIDQEDAERYRHYFELKPDTILVTGDTKNDQVLYRKEKAFSQPVFPDLHKSEKDRIFVAGSIWPEDWEIIKEPIRKLLNRYGEFRVILCPHELDKEFILSLEEDMKTFHPLVISPETATENISHFPKVMIINRMGILADLYSMGDVAFVGGSFKGKVHNVLEPAIYGIPVVTGPHIHNSTEAIKLEQEKGLFVVRTTEECEEILSKCITDETFRQQHGIYASSFVLKRINTVSVILNDLNKIGIISEANG